MGDGVFEVKSTSGDTHLGGDDFYKKLVDWMAGEFQRNESIDLRKDKQALQRLNEAAEKAKIELSSTTQTAINLPFVTATQERPKHLDLTLTRGQFEQMCADLFDRCRIPVEQALKDANLTSAALDEVVLVGGSTRIPAVQQLVRRMTGKDPNQGVNNDLVCDVLIRPDEVVLGANISVPTPDGSVTVKVPKGVRSGQPLRLRSKGWVMPKGGRSDLFAKLQIVTPKDLSPIEQEYYEKIQATTSFNPRTSLEGVKL